MKCAVYKYAIQLLYIFWNCVCVAIVFIKLAKTIQLLYIFIHFWIDVKIYVSYLWSKSGHTNKLLLILQKYQTSTVRSLAECSIDWAGLIGNTRNEYTIWSWFMAPKTAVCQALNEIWRGKSPSSLQPSQTGQIWLTLRRHKIASLFNISAPLQQTPSIMYNIQSLPLVS